MDQVKKRQIKQILGWVAIVIVIGLLASVPMLARSGSEEDPSGVRILSGVVQSGTIETILQGGGRLEAQDPKEITVSYGIQLERFLVSNGDYVAAGDPVAEVDKVSVRNAIVQVQEKLDSLKENMADASDSEMTAEVKTKSGGRVKVIYGQPGDRVRDVMLEYGALAVLSLDGRMAVRLNSDIRLPIGKAVTMTFEDGTEAEGRVESGLDGGITVSTADEGYSIGTLVTVSTEDMVLGTGALYVHNPWNAVAWSGMIEEIFVKPEQSVDAGDVLFELRDVDSSKEFVDYAEEHREYEQIMQSLFRILESGVITSQYEGMISAVDESSMLLVENDRSLNDFSLDESVIMTVTPQNSVVLTITLDERDIGQVKLGQSAQVKVDALKGRTFDAVVTEIGTHGTNNGGSSKFRVTLTMNRCGDMLPGMCASASITLGITDEVVTIPVAALCDVGNQTVVYTGYDPENGGLIDPVVVSTGVSDGDIVEIINGLNVGAILYYPYFEG